MIEDSVTVEVLEKYVAESEKITLTLHNHADGNVEKIEAWSRHHA